MQEHNSNLNVQTGSFCAKKQNSQQCPHPNEEKEQADDVVQFSSYPTIITKEIGQRH
jgi:hypothetical protein